MKQSLRYVPLTTDAMLLAARLWADARKGGYPTATDPALDGDVILAAQARLLIARGEKARVVTCDVGDLARFVPAVSWRDALLEVDH